NTKDYNTKDYNTKDYNVRESTGLANFSVRQYILRKGMRRFENFVAVQYYASVYCGKFGTENCGKRGLDFRACGKNGAESVSK
ncbi:MAG: hypothetical protein OSJ61_16925, partial [Lachnospiraceae bacterium]|nr:hypothetical protein [Lachnospiraceae bacterium]